jgi:hypothetical protein
LCLAAKLPTPAPSASPFSESSCLSLFFVESPPRPAMKGSRKAKAMRGLLKVAGASFPCPPLICLVSINQIIYSLPLWCQPPDSDRHYIPQTNFRDANMTDEKGVEAVAISTVPESTAPLVAGDNDVRPLSLCCIHRRIKHTHIALNDHVGRWRFRIRPQAGR